MDEKHKQQSKPTKKQGVVIVVQRNPVINYLSGLNKNGELSQVKNHLKQVKDIYQRKLLRIYLPRSTLRQQPRKEKTKQQENNLVNNLLK